jgi:hypothetical protein
MFLVFADFPHALYFAVQIRLGSAAADRTQGVAGKTCIALGRRQRLQVNGLVGRGQVGNRFVIA